ncbi:MAG TPA: carboxypeptidase-like regulatory domain-containing protein [Bacteroidales bacterium]|nr:carboxypeptidase-like regulatory domain-containing protein [Bacteroidales bacterium]HPS26814.1 carboxypeptidase-like regulatory domain-containing protein [Bacteroidales bacterium]
MKKVMVSILLVSLVTMFSSAAYCSHDNNSSDNGTQKASITGKVADKKTGESLAGVLLSIKDSGLNIYTDLDGNFTFENIEPGTYIIEVKYISYSLNETQKVTCSAGTETRLNIEIKSN